MNDIIFVGSAKDYHTMDWYRQVRDLCPQRYVAIATDLIESEGHARLVTPEDNVLELCIVDSLLLGTQSALGNLWRNVVKLIALPISVLKLRALARRHKGAIFHAHSMFYIMLCWAARVRFIATPMGSDVLVRPDHSALYRYFTIRSLRGAAAITVDSRALQLKIHRLCGVDSHIVQNGIDTEAVRRMVPRDARRTRVVSLRALDPNYRIVEIVKARDAAREKVDLDFIYPFDESGYAQRVKGMMTSGDRDHGRLNRNDMYALLAQTRLAISIPISDSSPRTVYESIFAGCCVAVSPGGWIEELPACMRARLFLVDDPERHGWFDEALAFADRMLSVPYEPSREAIERYDQKEAMLAVCRRFYGEAA